MGDDYVDTSAMNNDHMLKHMSVEMVGTAKK